MNRETAVQLALIAAAGVAAYWFIVRPARAVAGAVADAYSPGGVAYQAGDSIQDAIIPGVDSLGTWLYGLLHPDDGASATAPTAAAPKPGPAPAYDYGFGAGSGPLRPAPAPVSPVGYYGLPQFGSFGGY